MKKIIIGYLCSGYVKTSSLKNFLYNFKKYQPGYNYELLICFKNLSKLEKKKRLKLIKNPKIQIFNDTCKINDHEWGTLKRLCELKKNKVIFWMNDHAYPVKKNWLKIIIKHYKKNRFLGTSGSCSSHYSNSFIRKEKQNIFQFFYNIFYFFFTVPKFPNCHIRTNGFLIKSNDFLEFIENKIINSKFKSLLIESGYNSLTNFFLKKKYKIFIINKNGKKFNLNNMKNSNTFSSTKKYFLISDKQIRNYFKLSNKDKQKKSKHIFN